MRFRLLSICKAKTCCNFSISTTNKMSHFVIREADVNDFENVFRLLEEFALFQKTPERLTTTVAQMKKDAHLFHCLVAITTDNKVVGFVTYYPVYYSWSGKAFYADDLYIAKAFRKQGIGKALLQAIINKAKESGCKKVRWQVSEWNQNAIDFYKSIGAAIDDTESNCDLLL